MSRARVLVAICATALTMVVVNPPASAATIGGSLVMDDGNTGQIYTLTESGTDVTQVTHVPQDRFALAPRWSPDGSRIAFVIVANGVDRMYTMAADGSDVHKVRSDGGAWNNDVPDYYPSGSRFVFARCHTDGSGCVIARVRVDGTRLHALTSPRFEVYDFAPRVSPDGRHIAFTRFNADGVHSQVWLMNADGSHQHAITPARLEATAPDWSPDASQLTVTSNCCRVGGDIFQVPASGAGLTRLTHTPRPSFSGASGYAPNGAKIAFISNRNYPDRSGVDLFVMHANGTHQRKVDTGLTAIGTLDWTRS